MIHVNTYRAYCRKISVYNEWAKQFTKPNGWIVIPADVKPPVKVTNEMRSAIEVYQWNKEPPVKYFAYVNEGDKTLTTWPGEKLGRVFFGREYRDNFGGKRVPIDVHGNNGVRYHGTYYKSAGDYARVTAYKGQIK